MKKMSAPYTWSNIFKNRDNILRYLLCIILVSTVSSHLMPADVYSSELYEVVTVISENDLGRNLRNPAIVFTDKKTGELYTLTSGENQLVIYDSDYLPLMSLGPGRGVDAPTGLYVDPKGLLYICQRTSRLGPLRLTILNAAFLPLKEIDLSQYITEKGKAFSPQRVAVNKNGKIYITGTFNSKILVLDENGGFLYWYTPGEKGKRQNFNHEDLVAKQSVEEDVEQPDAGEVTETIEEIIEDDFEIPEDLLPYEEEDNKVIEKAGKEQSLPRINDVIVDGERKLYFLSEEIGKIFVHDADENFLFSFGTKGGSEGKLSRPKGLAVDGNKEFIYVVDYMRHTILAYNFDGKFQFEIGGKGVSPGWFNFPTSIAVNDKGLVFVADYFNHRIQVLRIKVEKASFEF